MTFSVNKIVGSLFHSLVINEINDPSAAEDTSTRMATLYMRDSINNLRFLSYHLLTCDSEKKNF